MKVSGRRGERKGMEVEESVGREEGKDKARGVRDEMEGKKVKKGRGERKGG